MILLKRVKMIFKDLISSFQQITFIAHFLGAIEGHKVREEIFYTSINHFLVTHPPASSTLLIVVCLERCCNKIKLANKRKKDCNFLDYGISRCAKSRLLKNLSDLVEWISQNICSCRQLCCFILTVFIETSLAVHGGLIPPLLGEF